MFADDVVKGDALRDPIFATGAGITDYDDQLPDFSPEGTRRHIEATEHALRGLKTLVAGDDIDRLALWVMDERLTTRLSLLESGEAERVFSVISSPLSEIRQVFELMGSDSAEERDVIARRLDQVPASLTSWRRTIEALAERGELPSRRHVLGIADQASTYANGAFLRFAERVVPGLSDESDLARAARRADGACGELSRWLSDIVAARAGEVDSCGRERYRVWSKNYNGAELDFEELYAWGWATCGASARVCGRSLTSCCRGRRVSSKCFTSWRTTRQVRCMAPTRCSNVSSISPSAVWKSSTAFTSTSTRAFGFATRGSRPKDRPPRRTTSPERRPFASGHDVVPHARRDDVPLVEHSLNVVSRRCAGASLAVRHVDS